MNEIIVSSPSSISSTEPGRISPVDIFLAQLPSANSKRTMESYLVTIVEIMRGQPFKTGRRYTANERQDATLAVRQFPWHALTYDMAMAIRANLVSRYSPRTTNGMIVAMRRVLGICYSQAAISREQYERITNTQNGLKLEAVDNDKLAGRELKDRELSQLKQACLSDKNEAAGARDAAIIGLLYVGMLRRFELAKIQMSDYEPETGNLSVTGKRRKTRTVRASASVRDLINAWLEKRGMEPEYLFLPVNKGGKIEYTRTNDEGEIEPSSISDQAVYNMLRKRAEQAGIDGSTLSPHDFRRTAITHHWRSGTPGPRIQKLAGHSSIATTGRYDRSDLEEALEAAEKLDF